MSGLVGLLSLFPMGNYFFDQIFDGRALKLERRRAPGPAAFVFSEAPPGP